MRTVFLDRDGVINENSPDHVKNWDEFVFLPHVCKALRWLSLAGFHVFVVTNQAIVNRGLVTHTTIEDIHKRMIAHVKRTGGSVTAVRYCPHDEYEQCFCRKPRPGMVLSLAAQWGIDLDQAYMVGDAWTDIAAAQAAGCRAILVRTGRGALHAQKAEIRIHRPDYIAPDLLGAVQWMLRREWMLLTRIELKRAVGYRKAYQDTYPTILSHTKHIALT